MVCLSLTIAEEVVEGPITVGGMGRARSTLHFGDCVTLNTTGQLQGEEKEGESTFKGPAWDLLDDDDDDSGGLQGSPVSRLRALYNISM